MNYKLFFGVLLCPAVSLLAAPGVETVFQRVALSGQPAPGLSNNIVFSAFNYVSLADDGRIAFTANVSGLGVTSTNNLGLWAGLPGDLYSLVRTGDPIPGLTNGATYTYFWWPTIDNHQTVGFAANQSGFLSSKPTIFSVYGFIAFLEIGAWIFALPESILSFESFGGHFVNAITARVELSGTGVSPTNNQAIIAGTSTNGAVVARTGFPATGVSGNFTGIPLSSKTLAISPAGNVAFIATADDPPATRIGLWFGKAGTLQLVAPNPSAPDSLLGSGYALGGPSSENVEVNAKGELAFATHLTGPGLNNTNSEFVVAGTPTSLRVVAQSGQPAPGIPGAFFLSYFGGPAFSHVLLGADGTVAFIGNYGDSGYDSGLWLAPTNGATPILLLHSGQQAPGAPAGVLFTNSFPYLPPFESVFMNGRNQIAFRARVGGSGVGSNNYGIWLAEPDGSVNLIARTGDSLDVGGGVMKQLSNVTFGIDPEFIAGPEDGRRSPFNDRGEVALSAYFTDFTQGLFIARTGIVLSGDRVGNDIRIKFPTISGKHYRVDYTSNLPPPPTWPVLESSVLGTGAEVTVTNANATAFDARFYRVVRTD